MLRLAKSYVNSIVYFTFLLLCAALLAGAPQSEAQSLSGNLTIEKGGQLWIDGKAGPVDFRCHAKELSGKGQIKNTSQPQNSVIEDSPIQISVSLPVKSLDCGKRAMNADMYDALRAEQHPIINYQLLEANLVGESQDSAEGRWLKIDTRGIMEIAGVKDTTEVVVEGKVDNDRFHVKGNKKIHMDTYNIDPPSKMFGIIKTDKRLNVHFDVTVRLTAES